MIQLTPLAIYNFTVFDQMTDLPPADQYDPDNPPESLVVLSLGTDTTDLVITNGYRVWQRSVPLGGSHFTKALSKELRLTFAKAEHLKRNAMQAEDRGAVFQAMRPVFNDLLTEIQRSIGFFSNIGSSGSIGRVLALGNATKLPGLQKYLASNLGYPVIEVEAYRGLTGSAVVASPIFKENLLGFAVCYGLALQGLGKAKLSTNLLPREILTDRLIRDKKPWGIGVAAAILLGFALSILGYWRAWNSVYMPNFQASIQDADGVDRQAKDFAGRFGEEETKFKDFDTMGQNIVGNVEGRLLWLEVLEALDSALPRDPDDRRQDIPISERNELHITDVECEHRADLSTWFKIVEPRIKQQRFGQPAAAAGAPGAQAAPPIGPDGQPVAAQPGPPGQPAAVPPGQPIPAQPGQPIAAQPGPPAAGPPDPAAAAQPASADAPLTGPTGPGWVIQLKGYHYHNADRKYQGWEYLRSTLIKNLETGKVGLPSIDAKGKEHALKPVPIASLGIAWPVIVNWSAIHPVTLEKPDAEFEPDPNKKNEAVWKYDFTVQFCWQETPPSKRRANEEAARAVAAGQQPPAAQPLP